MGDFAEAQLLEDEIELSPRHKTNDSTSIAASLKMDQHNEQDHWHESQWAISTEDHMSDDQVLTLLQKESGFGPRDASQSRDQSRDRRVEKGGVQQEQRGVNADASPLR